jgi:hypothetical protein
MVSDGANVLSTSSHGSVGTRTEATGNIGSSFLQIECLGL